MSADREDVEIQVAVRDSPTNGQSYNNPDLSPNNREDIHYHDDREEMEGRMERRLENIRDEITQNYQESSQEKQEIFEKMISLEQEVKRLRQESQNNNGIVRTPRDSDLHAYNRDNHLPRRTLDTSPDPEIDFPYLNRGDNSSEYTSCNIKLKPPKYDCKEDIYDFLESFKICSEINKWNMTAKGLYLASSLVGNARSVLAELPETQKTNYRVLVQKLTERYGSLNQTEVFKVKLRNRRQKHNESISEIAQSIKKMTQLAYPKVPTDVIESMAMDYFIDSLSDSNLRLRLREADLRSLSDAEQTATRWEAYRVAEKQRNMTVNVSTSLKQTEQSQPTMPTKDQKLESLTETLNTLIQEFRNFKRQTPNQGHWTQNRGRNQYDFNRDRRNMTPQSNRYPAPTNQGNQSHQTYNNFPTERQRYNNQTRYTQNDPREHNQTSQWTQNRQSTYSNAQANLSGNGRRSSWGAAGRPNNNNRAQSY